MLGRNSMKKCDTCNHLIHADCNYNQGRCPHRNALVEIPEWRKFLYLLISPIFICAFVISNPKKVWEQAKKDWNIK